ncbi:MULTISPECIES: hybrid sensor histidine kinase/response regulator [unclassified Moorena]|uniref:sensor histidine kinase n=1 Tax=unclassified Moorena TaxID=2683338 RepID=UPI0013C26206|nr:MULTISPECIES: hybrid sensor histidine kinase/response regulator [unclassified Moorena]NEO06599.1 hybrid sensor histidine kinase/response regulator [Moorena sp. SIO3I8]NEP25932.1 hybrid sensor histidine kinase/response regulator [Moorena sp. SIO3I6]NEQ60945.1 hybrid sensor histidine kinase/response regulator [Moorena sp. SIO4A1]
MNALPLTRPSKTDRILAVDDSPDNLFLLQTLLEEEGYEITLAENGRVALEKIEISPPELVLLDVMMPEMDGFEVTKRIRSNPKLPFIPILLITAYDHPSVVQGLDMGADDFIRKPVEVDELLARVRSLLRLKHSVDERDEIARQREDFVSRLTHDLRTPLVAADRILNLMQQGALGEISPPVLEAIVTMTRSNHNLLTMVNTLLEVYRYEAGRKYLSFSAIPVEQVIEEVIQELSALARDKKLSLDYQTPKEVNSIVMGDRLELHRLFMNLLGNAIKFTDNGSVTVRLRNSPKTSESNQSLVVIEVEDTGFGISPEDQKELFERFRQGSHKRSGSGLGLYLSKRILEAHQGTINVKSELGKGTLFTVTLPNHVDA